MARQRSHTSRNTVRRPASIPRPLDRAASLPRILELTRLRPALADHFDLEVFGGLGGGEDPGSQLPVSTGAPSEFYASTAEEEAEAFVAMARLRASWYRLGAPYQKTAAGTGVLLVPFGDDMKFQNAHKQFMNMDALMRTINAKSALHGVHVAYGTLGDYFNQLAMEEASTPWPSYQADFLPLATNQNVYSDQVDWSRTASDKDTQYWTGHYSTRPLMKGLTSRAGAVKHVSEIAHALAQAKGAHTEGTPLTSRAGVVSDDVSSDLLLARKVVGVLQHHDSITGTSKPEVTADLDVRLRASIAASTRVLDHALHSADSSFTAASTLPDPDSASSTTAVATPSVGAAPPILLDFGRAASTFKKDVHSTPHGGGREEGRIGQTVSLFNGLLHERVGEPVTLTLAAGSDRDHLKVVDATTGRVVPAVLVPPVPTPFSLGGNKTQLIFSASVGPLATAHYNIEKASNSLGVSHGEWDCSAAAPLTLSTDLINVSFDPMTHRLRQLSARANLTAPWLHLPVEQQFASYHSTAASNAYQFAPNRSIFPFGEIGRAHV